MFGAWFWNKKGIGRAVMIAETMLSRLIEAGVLRTTLSQDLGLINVANLKAAHKLIESGTAISKVLLTNFHV